MRLIIELCREQNLAVIINIHDVALAQLFVDRVVGLAAGEIVFDGKPEELTDETLTLIYGEEDWSEAEASVEDAETELDTKPLDTIAKGAHP